MRGRSLYLNSKTLACINCHHLEGIGGSVGPDLTRLWETQSIEKVIESLLEPSKEIKEGFQSYVASTTKGQVFTGLKILDNAEEVVLRDAEGRDVRLAKKDVEELKASKKSLMPDNVISQLNYGQFIDLVAFLKDRKAQESLRGLVLDYHVVGPFDNDLKKEYPPEKKADPKEVYPGKPGQTLKWQPAQAEPNGLLNLGAIFKADQISAYALTHVYAPKSQQADMLLGSHNAVRVWVNGKLVREYTGDRPAKPDDDQVAVMLEQGWNVILVKVGVKQDKDQGVYLRFVGEGLRISRNPVEDKLPRP
jgi:quinoprotein glucose dehydrogenase